MSEVTSSTRSTFLSDATEGAFLSFGTEGAFLRFATEGAFLFSSSDADLSLFARVEDANVIQHVGRWRVKRNLAGL